MTALDKITPTPAQVQAGYRKAFDVAIEQIAGKDRRISRSEAAKAAGRPDAGKLVSDNILNWLDATGQKSVGATKFMRTVAAYAGRMAERHAGPNQKLSLVEIRNLPADLVADLMHLRGKDSLPSVAPRVPSVAFNEGAIYELMYYRPEGPWSPERIVDRGVISHDGTAAVVSGLNDVGDWKPAAVKVLQRMWGAVFIHRLNMGQTTAALADNGSVAMGPIINSETGKRGLLVHYSDIDDSSYAFFARKDSAGEWQIENQVFLN